MTDLDRLRDIIEDRHFYDCALREGEHTGLCDCGMADVHAVLNELAAARRVCEMADAHVENNDQESGDDLRDSLAEWRRVRGANAAPVPCGRPLAEGQWWHFCGESDMGQTAPVLCEECDPKNGLRLRDKGEK